MKHLKTYKLYESNNEVLDYIGEILHDIEDDGFEVNYYVNRNYTINIDISLISENDRNTPLVLQDRNSFNWSDISGSIEHISNYLKDYSYEFVEIQYYSMREKDYVDCSNIKDMEGESIGVGTYDCRIDVRVTYGTKYEARSLKAGSGGYLTDI